MKNLKFNSVFCFAILFCGISNASFENEQRLIVPTGLLRSPIQILSVLPQSGAVETMVRITGSGFTDDNIIRIGEGVVMHVPIASSTPIACTRDPRCVPGVVQTLVFQIPTSLVPLCYYATPRCASPASQTNPGDYVMSVENANGSSNAISFKVTRY